MEGTIIYRSSREIKEEMAGLNIELAIQQEFEKEMDALEQARETPDEELQAMVEAARPRILKRFAQELSRVRMRRMRKGMTKIAAVVLILLMVSSLGLVTAVATIAPVRVKVMELLVLIEERYSRVSMQESGKYIDVPAGWEGYYYMSYIPEGYRIMSQDEGGVWYEDASGNQLRFGEWEMSDWVNIDTEDAPMRYVSLKYDDALMIEKNGRITLTWSRGNRFFVLKYTGTEEEAIRIADGVMMIR